jgi:prepilin-type N-terminal cleavage/methylation domain-containing protein
MKIIKLKSAPIFKIDSQRGMSILEVLIGIVILSFLMLGVYSIVDNSTATKEKVVKEDREFMQAQAALYRIETDFSYLYSPLFSSTYSTASKDDSSDAAAGGKSASRSLGDRYKNFTKSGQPIPTIELTKEAVSFMTAGHQRKYADTKEAKFAWVKYQLVADTDGLFKIQRLLSPENPFGAYYDWDKIRPITLLRGVKDWEVSFWSEKLTKFTENLDDLTVKDAPRSLKIIITGIDNTKNEYTMTRIVRVIWPFYNSEKDEIEMKKTADENRAAGNVSPDSDGNDGGNPGPGDGE